MPSSLRTPSFGLAALVALACLTLGGCATRRAAEPKPKPAPPVLGTISMVNEELGFVLIDSAESFAPGTVLKALAAPDRHETGTLSVSSEQKRPFFIAEITAGAPQPGNWVVKP